MNTFSKKLVTFLSTLMGVGLIYVAVLMFVGQTSTNTYYKDSNNAVQKVMADLNFYQSNNGGKSELYNNIKEENKLYTDESGHSYSSKMYPLQEVYQTVMVTKESVPPIERIPFLRTIPTPIRYVH